MKSITRRDVFWLVVVVGLDILWIADRTTQANRAASLESQMNRYHWQADKLAKWIDDSEGVTGINVNDDAITIETADGRSHGFQRK